MRLKLMIAAAAAALAAQTASAQVFVIGQGLGGECYQKTKNGYVSFRSAEEVCTRALREQAMTKTNRAATYVNRGVLRMREGLYEKALSDYSQAKELTPDLGPVYLNEGAAHIYLKDFESVSPRSTARLTSNQQTCSRPITTVRSQKRILATCRAPIMTSKSHWNSSRAGSLLSFN